MTRTFCNTCGKEITKEKYHFDIPGTGAELCKPAINTNTGVNLTIDICWDCTFRRLEEYLEFENDRIA